MYRYAISFLKARGFDQYEISNFALTGYRCSHNINYWDRSPYTGLGPSAVSYRDGSREENVRDVREYIRCVEDGRTVVASKERLSSEASARETAAVKIRTMDGINLKWFREMTGFDLLGLEAGPVKRLYEEGLIECNAKDVRLTQKGILFCDIVSSAFV
jgi:oxygen-independent coproporphyrinogen III oxidase